MTEITNCPVCKTLLSSPFNIGIGHVECKRCGIYELGSPNISFQSGNNYSALNELTIKERANCSGLIRENQDESEFWLTPDHIEKFKNHRHPHIFEKADKLLLHFDKNTDYAGQWLNYLSVEKQEELMGVSWAVPSDENVPYKELYYLLKDYLWLTKHFLEVAREGEAKNNSKPGSFWDLSEFRVSPLGHEYIQTLKQTVINSNQGFSAMWFGGEKHKSKYDDLWSKAIEPAIKQAGYNAQRIDKKDHVNNINDEMLMEIRRSRFVVCDFNERCNGVYFEAGFALGLNLPVIWTCEEEELKNKRLHFDVDHYSFLAWKYEELDDFRVRLHKRIEAILGHGKNPPN